MIVKEDRGAVQVEPELCKGCGLCVQACNMHVLQLAHHLNHTGYHPAEYTGHGCNGCGLCFYACPEPNAIRVFKRVTEPRPLGSGPAQAVNGAA